MRIAEMLGDADLIFRTAARPRPRACSTSRISRTPADRVDGPESFARLGCIFGLVQNLGDRLVAKFRIVQPVRIESTPLPGRSRSTISSA